MILRNYFPVFVDFRTRKSNFLPISPLLNHFKIVQQAESERPETKLSGGICLKNSHYGGRVSTPGPWSKLMEIPAAQLTLEKVIQTCRQVELTAAHINTLKSPKVYYAKVGYQGTNPYCDKCTKHHAPRTCPAYNKYCNVCGLKGHFKASPICKGPQRAPGSSRFPRRRSSGRGRSNSRGRSRNRGYSRGYSGYGRGSSGYGRGASVHFTENIDYVDNEQPDPGNIDNMFDQCTIHDKYAADTDSTS